MTANYLRTLNWTEDTILCTKIEEFYSKANALTHLARFYEEQAQNEIDAYRFILKRTLSLNTCRDYERGWTFLDEAKKTLEKISASGTLLDRFLTALVCRGRFARFERENGIH